MNMPQTKISSFLTSGADVDGSRVDKKRLEANAGRLEDIDSSENLIPPVKKVSRKECIGETEEELPPSVLNSRKRRKVIFDSDDEQSDSQLLDMNRIDIDDNIPTVLANAFEHIPDVISDDEHIPGPDDDENDEGDNEPSELLEIQPFENIPDTLPDEQYIPGPEEDDEDNKDNTNISEPLGSQPFKHPRNGTKLAVELRKCLQFLANWTHECDLKRIQQLDREHRLMTYGYWYILGKISIDTLMNRYLSGLSDELFELVENPQWSTRSIIAFKPARKNPRQGIYCDVVCDTQCRIYVGSARSIKERISRHLSISEKYHSTQLPKELKGSQHYQTICSREVTPQFRLLAAFDQPIELGYLLLLESVLMVILDTYRYPGYLSNFAPKSTYNMVAMARRSLDLPIVPWQGLNAAWPLYQGFNNREANSESPCVNPACRMMTYPYSKRPPGVLPRMHSMVGNPLSPYLCGRCGTYKYYRHGVLPNAQWVAKVEFQSRRRQLAGPDAKCECCGRLESQSYRDHKKEKHSANPLNPMTFICNACRHFFNLNNRLRTAKETEYFLTKAVLCEARKNGTPIPCDNCTTIEGSPECNGRQHVALGKAMQILYPQCAKHFVQRGGSRPQHLVVSHRVRFQMQSDRKSNLPIICSNCGSEEQANDAKHYNVSSELAVILCSPCGMYYSKHKTHRPPEIIQHHRVSVKLRHDREVGNPIECEICHALESNCIKKHVVTKGTVRVFCFDCSTP